MDEIRRIVSLFVGLIVVLLIVAYALGKMGFYSKNSTAQSNGALAGVFGKKQPTPRVTSKKITIKQVVDSDTSKINTVNTNPRTPLRASLRSGSAGQAKTTYAPTSIPETGAETAVLPVIASLFFGGVYLRRKI